jgi:probable HAF family extracellular repeat protein
MPIYTYTTIDDPLASATSGNGTDALGINAMGQIVGTYHDASSGHHGFLYSGGTYTTLDDPSAGSGFGKGTDAWGINASGQIVGDYTDSSNKEHGFLYNPNGGTYTTLDDPRPLLSLSHWASTLQAKSSVTTATAATSTASS